MNKMLSLIKSCLNSFPYLTLIETRWLKLLVPFWTVQYCMVTKVKWLTVPKKFGGLGPTHHKSMKFQPFLIWLRPFKSLHAYALCTAPCPNENLAT